MGTKQERHRADLAPLFEEWARVGDAAPLTATLVANSNLPGRRANLELAAAFGDAVAERAPRAGGRLWRLLSDWMALPPVAAPTNDPQEFLPFCGTLGLGALGAALPGRLSAALDALKVQANDPRWRTREAVCFGVQRMLAARAPHTLHALEGWVAEGSPLELRAVVASVAEPELLTDRETALAALRLQQEVVARVRGMADRKGEGFKTLRQALAYTLSVVVQALPEEGFAFLEELAAQEDGDLRWILRQNLKKKRLIRNYPERVAAMAHALG